MEQLVGRVDQLSKLLVAIDSKGSAIVNVYGVGGIGKTSLCNMLVNILNNENKKSIYLNAGSISEFQIDKLLGMLVNKLENSGIKMPNFIDQHKIYLEINKIDEKFGGISKLFGLSGTLADEIPVLKHIETASKITEEIRKAITYKVEKRQRYEQYLRGASNLLLESFKSDLNIQNKITFILDGYERFEFLDDDIRFLVSGTNEKHKFLLVGRNQLKRIEFQWRNYNINELELKEFSREESFEYLSNHKLTDKNIFDKLFEYTGGYPLALALTADLASFGGWKNIDLSTLRDMDHVAQGVLERLMEEMEDPLLSKIIELGPVASWIDPYVIQIIINETEEESGNIYDRLSKLSFMEYHQNGLKFHDRIREILVPRLKFRKKKEFISVVKRLRNYYESLEDLSNG